MSVTPSTASVPAGPVPAAPVLGPQNLPEHPLNTAAAALGIAVRAFRASLTEPSGSGGPSSQDGSSGQDGPSRQGAAEHGYDLAGGVQRLRSAFAQHREVTEGEHGLYAEVLADAPRLVPAVNSLLAEHEALDIALAGLFPDVSGDREQALNVLDALSRHGQHDADLLFDAYGTDIGGE